MRRLLVLAAALAATLAALLPAGAAAHPLGNFTINHYVRAELSGERVYLRYVADLAEIPAFRERNRVTQAGGLVPYAREEVRALAGDLVVTVDGRRVPVTPVSQVAAFLPGQAGLSVMRLAAWYRVAPAAVPAGGAHRLAVTDATFAGRLGWKEMVLRTTSGARAAGATVPATDTSNELRHYPRDLLTRPLAVTHAEATWTPGHGPGLVGPLTADPESRVEVKAPGGLGGLVQGDLTTGALIVALLLAMGWGALHSLSPGHGKSMVAAYLVGTHGRPRHAFILGGFVTLTHTIGVVLLGLITLWASAYVLPEDLYPWLNLVAALMVVGIGGWVLWGRLGRLRRDRAHERAHRVGAGHHGHGHDHVDARAHEPMLVGAGAGVVEAGHHHHHHHGPAGGHGHDHHGHGQGHDHEHGPGGHTHAPPNDLSMRSLVAVGASAGIIPCPSAMVLLLGAISLHRVGYGLVLVVAFSLGLAGVLSAIGLLVLYARRFVDRLPLDGRLAAAIPTLSALVIVGLGLYLTLRALPPLL